MNDAKSSRIDKKHKHSQPSQHQFLQSQLLEQSQIISNAEKRINSVEKQFAKLQNRVAELEWEKNSQSAGSWNLHCQTQDVTRWEEYNRRNVSPDGHRELDDWFFNSFVFNESGMVHVRHFERGVLGSGQYWDPNGDARWYGSVPTGIRRQWDVAERIHNTSQREFWNHHPDNNFWDVHNL